MKAATIVTAFLFYILHQIQLHIRVSLLMLSKLSGWDDTIVALATPSGIGAIGVIRLSGSNSINIVNKLFPSKDLATQSSHTLHVGFLKENDNVLDEVVVSVYKNPTSYTGEDIIEIGCHGSVYVQHKIIESLIKNGARMAKPGEFTQRAFLNGKLDLTQAEAVGDLIASNTAASQNAALNNIRGGFSEILKDLRDKLIQFASLIELELDFSEEDVEFADRRKFTELIHQIFITTKNLINSFQLGNVIKNGVSVAIIGKPNTGKSTLLNTLLNENRAIVSEIPGTTRDTIEEVLNIDGILFRMIDTAGIREHTSDVIENIGMDKSIEKMQKADIVIYLFDAISMDEYDIDRSKKELIQQGKKFLLVINKSDAIDLEKIKEILKELEVIFISAQKKLGIEELKKKIFSIATDDNLLSENIVVTNMRHYEALQQIESSLNDIMLGMENKLSGDLLSSDIRRCLYYLGEITGEITNEDRLDFIFSKFCIGK